MCGKKWNWSQVSVNEMTMSLESVEYRNHCLNRGYFWRPSKICLLEDTFVEICVWQGCFVAFECAVVRNAENLVILHGITQAQRIYMRALLTLYNCREVMFLHGVLTDSSEKCGRHLLYNAELVSLHMHRVTTILSPWKQRLNSFLWSPSSSQCFFNRISLVRFVCLSLECLHEGWFLSWFQLSE